MSELQKIIVILGPTASGKTDVGIEIAKKFNGEIVSADSRTVYVGMNIGTAKPNGEIKSSESGINYLEVEGMPHYLIDVVNPDEEFSLANYKEKANVIIKNILKRGRLPIVIGGTGLYIQTLVDNLDIPKVEPDRMLRAELEEKSMEELQTMLAQLDEEAFAKIDLNNPRRLIRALEIAIGSGESITKQQTKSKPFYNALQIGLNWSREELYERINLRVDKMMVDGLLEEAKELAKKYDWDLPSMSGIGYRQMGYFLRGEMTFEQAIEKLKQDTRHYSKRQMTWFNRDKRVNWIDKNNVSEAEKLVNDFLSQ